MESGQALEFKVTCSWQSHGFSARVSHSNDMEFVVYEESCKSHQTLHCSQCHTQIALLIPTTKQSSDLKAHQWLSVYRSGIIALDLESDKLGFITFATRTNYFTSLSVNILICTMSLVIFTS